MKKVNGGGRGNSVKWNYSDRFFRMLIVGSLLLGSGELVAQSFQWAKSIESEGFDEGYDLVADPDGNTYVAGMIEFDTDFGDGVVLSSAGIHDIFLAKYSPTGRLVWAKIAGGKGGDKIQSITLDDFGNIYVAGEYEDTCYWDGIMKVTNGPGVNNMFIAKYDTAGTVNWVRNIGGSGVLHTRGYGITCDEFGNVYACGGLKGDAYYNNNFLFSTAGDYDGMVVKFNANGNFQWARRMGGSDSDKAYGIVSDRSGSVYVTGYFVGHADFSTNVSLQGIGHTDIFLSKYDNAGTLQWAKQAGDTGFDRGWDITQNVNGQIIITGEFQTGYFGSNIAYSKGNQDMFLAAYTTSGDNLWAISGGGEEDDIGRGVSHDPSGNIYVVGDFASTGIFALDTVVSNGFSDVFLASYTSDGSNMNWIRSFGGSDNDRGRGVGSDQSGNISICGEYVDSARFDGTNLIGDTLLDIFVAKVIPGNFCATQVTISATNTCFGNCDGVADATVTGVGPFVYSWSTTPPQSGSSVSGLCAGTYTVATTDASGCSSTASVTLIEPLALQPTATYTNAVCAGSCDGIAQASATGQGPFSYSWSTNPPQSQAMAIGLCQGSYTVTVLDSAGCSATSTVTLTDPQPLQISAVITDASCIACSDGSIDLLVSGGATNYQYSWSNSSTDEDPQNLVAGTYSVCVTDQNNCMICDTFSVIAPSTGVSPLSNKNGYSVFPNPSSLNTTIRTTSHKGETTRFKLFTTTGQMVLLGEFTNNEYQLNSSNIESGIYFLQLSGLNYDKISMIPLVIQN